MYLTLKFENQSILTKVSTVKFLGVTLDENLTFKNNVNMVTSKILKSVGVMRLHCQLLANVMVELYCSLVFGVFEFDFDLCIPI